MTIYRKIISLKTYLFKNKTVLLGPFLLLQFHGAVFGLCMRIFPSEDSLVDFLSQSIVSGPIFKEVYVLM